MERVMSGVQRIDPHDIPHFCYSEDSIHDATDGEEFDEIDGLFDGFLIERVSFSHEIIALLIIAFGRVCDTFLLAHSQRSTRFTVRLGQKGKDGG